MSDDDARTERPPRIPHVYAIIFSLIVLMALVSLVVPSGGFERDGDGRVVPDTFAYDGTGGDGIGGWKLLFAVFTAPLRGFGATADIIAFILVVGGAFQVLDRTGAFDALIRTTVRALGNRPGVVFAVSMLLFSVGGAVFGMSEEVIPFILLFVPLARALGYDPVIGVAVPLVGAGVGFAGAMINPFTVGVAQAIAGLPPLSGWEFRTGVWAVVTAIGITYVVLRSRRLRTPAASRGGIAGDDTRLTRTHVAVLLVLAAGIGLILFGVGYYQWYVIEIGAVFLGLGIVAGFVARLSGSEIARAFLAGARDLVSAAVVVGLARGIVLVAQDTRVLDTILYGMSNALGALPGAVSINLMFLFQSALNFLVPSGSGQAALTMPIMAPLAELVGLTRQMAVLAYQFGDGFSNLIIPTGPVLMGSLEIGKVRYERWFAFAWPLQLWLFGTGVVLLTLAVAIGFR